MKLFENEGRILRFTAQFYKAKPEDADRISTTWMCPGVQSSGNSAASVWTRIAHQHLEI